MLKAYLRILKKHSEDVFGVGASTTLSVYTVLSIACIVLPTLFFLVLIIRRIF